MSNAQQGKMLMAKTVIHGLANVWTDHNRLARINISTWRWRWVFLQRRQKNLQAMVGTPWNLFNCKLQDTIHCYLPFLLVKLEDSELEGWLGIFGCNHVLCVSDMCICSSVMWFPSRFCRSQSGWGLHHSACYVHCLRKSSTATASWLWRFASWYGGPVCISPDQHEPF